MKKITLSLFAAFACMSGFSQVMLSEDFTAPFTPASSNWGTNNQSTTIGTTPTWFQGNGAGVFPAYNGAANDYYGANFNNVTGAGTISNWLITPTLTIYNGAVLQFATRVSAAQPVFADRLQVRMSTAGTSSVIGTTPTSIGVFTDLMLDINPLYSTSATSVITGNTVNGYPQAWAVYTLQVTGVTNTVTGRFAFRYFVENGGPTGANSSYVGLDAVRYTLPCAPTVQSFTTCTGAPVTLQANGLPATTYSWSTNATSSSINVTGPANGVTTSYTLYPSANGVSCNNPVVASVTGSTNLQVNVTSSANNNTVCAGRTVTLTANSAGTGFVWTVSGSSTPIGNSAVITVTPSSTTSYAVGSNNGICFGTNTITINTVAPPAVSAIAASTLLCVGGPSASVSFTGQGASTYLWIVGNSSGTGATIGLNIPAQSATTAAVQIQTLGVIGTAANGCQGAFIYSLTINRTPTVTVAASKSVECVGRTVTLTATGADSYTWSGAASATTNQVNYSTGASAGTKTFNIASSTTLGCVGIPAVKTITVSLCTSIENIAIGANASVYPNPFTNELKVSGIDGRVELYNSLGQLVISATVNNSESINTADLAKGVYILKAFNTANQAEKTVKLLKN